MTDIKLSFCIPTYNRSAYLRSALERFSGYGFSFPYEIVISDNASTDDTPAMVQEYIDAGLPIRYFRRSVNGGSGPNLTNAYQQALGEYSVYHADDDMLFPAGVESALVYLDANPDVVAAHAPWYLYDEVNDKDLSQFFQMPADRKFDRQAFVEAFEFMYEGHVFPEIAICRSSALHSAWVPRDFAFFAFSHTAHLLDLGAVAFLKQPFYRSVVVSKIAPERQQAGFDDVMTSWDKYRGGLEYFLHVAERRGKLAVNEETRPIFERMCRNFTLIRMSVAIRFWVQRKDFIKAYELYTRMVLGGMGDHPEVAKLRDQLPIMVALQTLAYNVSAGTHVTRLVLNGLNDPDYVGTLLRELGLREDVELVVDTGEDDPALADVSAAFSIATDKRAEFLARGYRPNLIFVEEDLMQHTLI